MKISEVYANNFYGEVQIEVEYEDGRKEFLFGYDPQEFPIDPSRFIGMTREEVFELKRTLELQYDLENL